MVHNHKPFWSGALVFAYLAFGTGTYVDTLRHIKPTAREEAAAFAASLPRKVYKYSVVAGGAFTPEELAAARRADPVVAEHYSDFGPHTVVKKLERDMYVQISYRKDNKVYWSRKTHKVCKGETVITDGKNMARTRCANRIRAFAGIPPLSVNVPPMDPPDFDAPAEVIDPPDEQTARVFNPLLDYQGYHLPEPPPTPAQTGASGAKPSTPDYGGGGFPSDVILPLLAPLAGIGPLLFAGTTTPVTPPVVPPVTVPEPMTIALVIVSIIALWVVRKAVRTASN